MDFQNIHQILQTLYLEMLQHTEDMQDVARGIAGLGALAYVSYRIFQSLARAEPVDVFPLLRPIALGLCIILFPAVVLGTLNGVLSPIVQGTHKMLENQTFEMQSYLEKKQELQMKRLLENPETSYLVDNEEYEKRMNDLGMFDVFDKVGLYLDRAQYNAEQAAQRWLNNILEIVFQAASLIIDVLRTFFLIVLAILGPIAFGISVFDGFQSTLTQWLSRYVSIYLWLPVSDMFGTILANLQKLIYNNQIENLHTTSFMPNTFDVVYVIFMLIGICGYMSVPTVASWIVQSGGGGNYSRTINTIGTKVGAAAGGFAGAAAGNAVGQMGNMGRAAGRGIRDLYRWIRN